ncbi:MAG: prepilin-type N-terminal cleavage/methylation domain-containing protein [Akkermansiaceae bacterium]|nr:prepilin-type N-terminal cleavage/methylation domain-containing protein [Akkermansiaceae bacterium]
MTRAKGITARRSRGFTLAELMVAMAVGTILLLVVLGVMSSGSEGYAAATGRIDANVEARAALTTFSDDLATIRPSPVNDLSFSIRQGEGVWPSSEAWFFALKPRSAQDAGKASGDLCFVYYYTAVTRELEGEAGPYSRKLYRRLISSADVMEMLRNGDDFLAPKPDPERLEDEAVAFNVVQFLAEPWVVNSESGQVEAWTRESGLAGPDFVDLTLRLTDDRTAALLSKEENWEGDWPLARQFFGEGPGSAEGKRMRTFKTRLPLDE